MLPIGKSAFTGTPMSYCPQRTIESIDKSKILSVKERYDPVSKRMIPICATPSIIINAVKSITTTTSTILFTTTPIPDEIRDYTVTFNGSSIITRQSPVFLTGLTPGTQYSVFISYNTTNYPIKTIKSNTVLFVTPMSNIDNYFLYYSATDTSITLYFSDNSAQHLYVATVNGIQQPFSSSGSSVSITGLSSGNTYQVNILNRDANGIFPDSNIISYKMKTSPNIPQITNPIIYQTLATINYSSISGYDSYYLALDNKAPIQQLITNPTNVSNLQPNTSYNLYELAYDSSNVFATAISSPNHITMLSTNYPVSISGYQRPGFGQDFYTFDLHIQPIYSLYVLTFQNTSNPSDTIQVSSNANGSYPNYYGPISISTPLSTGNIYSITVTASGPSGIITFSNYLFSLPT